jgi:outer membrane protein OmpA-like peptidoglycan-associated protein
MRLPPAAVLLVVLALPGCTTDPATGEQRVSRAAIGGIGGAIGGYLLGDLVGGRRDRTEKAVGAGIGAVAGAAVGAYMDEQERELRARTAGSGVTVTRQGDDLLLNMPSAITFATDSADVAPQFARTLDQVAEVLGRHERTFVDVYGHTDSVGSDAYNLELSRRRAAAVAGYLEARGLQPARVGIRGFGETQPVAPNDDEAGRAANRRVEIKVVPIAGQPA